jgi:hypothetical protein
MDRRRMDPRIAEQIYRGRIYREAMDDFYARRALPDEVDDDDADELVSEDESDNVYLHRAMEPVPDQPNNVPGPAVDDVAPGPAVAVADDDAATDDEVRIISPSPPDYHWSPSSPEYSPEKDDEASGPTGIDLQGTFSHIVIRNAVVCSASWQCFVS